MEDLEKSLFLVNNLTEDNLKEFSLSRVGIWSNFLNNLASNDNINDFVTVNEIDEIFDEADEEQANDNDSEHDISENIEDAAESDDSAVNISAIEQNLTISDANDILAVIAQNPNTTGIVKEDRQFLEKTLPIFEIFNHKIRQDGFERLLNTFDERKIERNIGKTLRPKNHYQISPYNRNCCSRGRSHRTHDALGDTDSDSFDETRYVRSTRDACDYNKRYEKITTTIKSFCSVKSRRDERAGKYAYQGQNKTMQDLFYGAKYHYYNAANGCQSWAGLRSNDHYVVDERSVPYKSYSKHRDRIYSDSSSSDEEFLHPNRCVSISQKRALHCRCQHFRSHNPGANKSCHFSKLSKMSHSCRNNMLPLMQETDCVCRGTDRLCNNARHLANSSTENWFVENCDSSEPDENTIEKTYAKKGEKRSYKEETLHRETSKQSKTSKFNAAEYHAQEAIAKKSEALEKLKSKTNISKELPKLNINDGRVKKTNTLTNIASKTNKNGELNEPTTSKSILKKSSKNKEVVREATAEDSFEMELQLALKASKHLYIEEMKRQQLKQADTKANDIEIVEKTEQYQKEKKNVSFQDERDKKRPKKLRGKKNFVPQLADISSESEFKENILKENCKSESQKQQNGIKRTKSKAFSKSQFKENMKTNKDSKSELHYISKSANVQKCNKQKSSKHNDLKSADVNKNIFSSPENCAYNTSKLQKLRIWNDSSSETADANDTVKAKTTNNVNVTENTTFFSNPGQICNSTALISPTAKSRQLLSTTTHGKISSSKITDTTVDHSDEVPSTSHANSETLKNEESSPTDSSDCKRVSSTTETEKSTQKVSKSNQLKPNHIVLYTPQDTTLAPQYSFVNNKFNLTFDHLASVIGQKYAKVFFRYYRGKRTFNLTSTVEYIPPKRGYYSGNDTSEDDIDPFDLPDIGHIVEQKN